MPALGTAVRTVHFEDGKHRDLAGSREEVKKFLKEEILVKSYEDLEKYYDIPLDVWISQRNVSPGMQEWLQIMGLLFSPSDRVGHVSAGDFCIRLKQVSEKHKGLASVGMVTSGLQSLTDPLAEAIRERGGEIRTGTKVSEIVIENGKVRGVLIEKGHNLFPAHVVDTEMIEAPVVICTLPVWDLFHVIPEDDLPRWYVDWVKGIQHKVTYVGGISVGTSKKIFEDSKKWYWVPRAPRTSKVTTILVCLPCDEYVKVPGEYQTRFDFQTTYKTMNLFDLQEAGQKKVLRRFFEDLEADLGEMFPGWEEHCLWKIRYVAPIDITPAPGLVGTHRPDRVLPGIENLYLVTDTLRHEKGNWSQISAYEALLATDQILRKITG
jgi:hypothetical protein